uniref:Uncharacterized protein n=1 Tax=Dolomedes mizhoanus TaxID=1366394 RepID=S5MFK5_9ARAC|nr:hypothetical protein [Dolomedes mizhoanus]
MVLPALGYKHFENMNYFKVTCLLFVVFVYCARSITGESENKFQDELEKGQGLIDEEEARSPMV